MQLVGNKQSSVNYTPSAIGANDDFSVIVPNQFASKIGLIVKGQTNQTGNLLELRDVNNVGWSAFSNSGSLSLGKTTATATLDVLGNTIVTGSVTATNFTGSLQGTATSASFAVSASYANNFLISGSQVITGSLYGAPISQSVASSTASLNLARGNFFNLTLPASTNTYITASGQLPGQTINLKITQGATSGSVSLGAGIRQVSGSSYTVTAKASTTDILTFISFDNTGLYVSSVKNLI